MFEPAAKVKVSVAASATTLSCPDTATVLNASVTVPAEGFAKDSVPLPSVVKTWLALPSLTFSSDMPTEFAAISLAPTASVAILADVTEFAASFPAVTFKSVIFAVVTESSAGVVLELKVTVSVPAVVVIVIPPEPAKVSVSVAPSATTLLCPETEIVLNASETVPPPPPDTVLNDNVPLPSVVNTWPLLPSLTFSSEIPTEFADISLAPTASVDIIAAVILLFPKLSCFAASTAALICVAPILLSGISEDVIEFCAICEVPTELAAIASEAT